MSRHDADNASINSLSSLLRTDDESATTTSTESESFESWTLITDKQKAKAAALQTKKNNNNNNNNNKNNLATTVENNRDPETAAMYSGVQHVNDNEKTIDDLDAAEENNRFSNKNNTDTDKDTDELSDGISIISESSESIGRLSPHPLLRAHLHNIITDDTLPSLLAKSQMNAEHIETVETDEEQRTANTQTRRRKRSNESGAEQALQTAAGDRVEQKSQDLIERISSNPLIKRGVNCLFYAGVTLALLAFIGRLRNPEWDVGDGQTLSELEQKINDLELQHNLMSAEIDLLNKQVNYLSGLNDKSQGAAGGGAKYKQEYQKPSKTFKAWSGNGKNMDAVNINKENLKRPYKCGEDDNFMVVGGLCLEKTSGMEEPLVDQVGNAVNDILQDSETYKSFEKVAEAFLNKGNEQLPPNNDDNANNKEQSNDQWRKQQPQYYGDKRPPTVMPAADNSKEFRGKKADNYKQQSRERKDNSDEDDDDDDDSQEQRMYGKRSYSSKERNYKSKRSSDERNSKERFDNYNKKQRKQYSSEERANKFKDPSWHNNLMQQREELRRQRHNHDKSNWFIERGDSREQARSS